MPFTISHIATATPFLRPLRRAGVLSAAVIGTMAPDFGLVLPGGVDRLYTHGWLPLFTFALPLGLLVWVSFQLLMKPAILEVFPNRWYTYFKTKEHGHRMTSPLRWMAVALALLLGALSHLAWDSFTHDAGVGERLLPILGQLAPSIAGHRLYWWQLMQHVSTLVGLAIVGYVIFYWINNAQQTISDPSQRLLSEDERKIWIGMYLVIPTICVIKASISVVLYSTPSLISDQSLSYLAIVGMKASSVALFAISALILLRLRLFIPSAPAR